MQNQKKGPGEIIRARRVKLTMSQRTLAEHVGTNQQTIGKIETGLTRNSPFLPLIASVLGIQLEELMPKIGTVPQSNRGLPPRDVLDQTQIREVMANRRDLPLHSTVEAGSGALVMSSDPIDRIDRPESLTHVKDAYAVMVVGESMFPVLKPGNKVKVHPHLPPKAEDLCVFIHEENGAFRATIKEYVGQTKDVWRVKRYYPKEEIILLKKREWPRCDVVVSVDYR